MIALTRMFIIITIYFSQCLFVASAEDSVPEEDLVTVEDYVKVCTKNQNNKMDRDLCECMGNEGNNLSAKEFDFFYAIAAKDQEKVNKGHTTLEPNQKINVMTLTMTGPTKCANKLAAQQNSSETPDNSDSAAGSVSESTNDAASATVSESADSASQ